MTEEVIEAVQPEEIPTTTEETQAPEAVGTTEPETKPEPKEDPIPKGVQRRIDRAVRQKYEAEARAKMLEERINAIEARQQQAPQQREPGAPKLEDFDNFDDYIEAKAAYVADKKINETLTQREQRQQAERAQTARQQTVEGWQKRVASATKELPDFEEVVASSDVPMTPVMAEAIMSSDAGPKLAYYLATHEDEAEEIARMSPLAVVRALTRIEDKLANQPAQASKAPPPVSPVGVKAKAERNPDDLPTDEWLKWRNKQVASNR